MLSIDDLTLTGDDKIKADLHGKNWRIYEEEKQKEQGEESSRELSESFNRQSQQLHFYSEMRISEQVEAMRRFKTKQSIEQTKPTTKPKNEQRDDDFTQWINESKPDLEQLTKKQVQQELIKRNRQLSNSQLWCSGFDDWIRYTELYNGKAGRPKTA